MKVSTPKAKRQPKTGSSPLTWRQLQQILTRPIAYHRIFATIAGGAKAGLFLSQGFYWTNIKDASDPEAQSWFYKTRVEWEFETGLTREEQETARRQLIKRGLLKEKKQGLPAKLFYQFQKEEILIRIWAVMNSDSAVLSQTSLRVSRKQASGKTSTRSAAKPQATSTQTSSRNTSSISSSSAPSAANGDDEQNLIDELRAQDVSPGRAKQLATKWPDEMRHRLEILPDVEIKTTAAQFLSARPEDHYSVPPARIKRLAAENTEALALAQAHANAERAKRQAENNARLRALDDQLDAHFKSLDAIDRADVDEHARRRLVAVMGETRETPEALAIARRQVLKKELGIPIEENDEETP